VKVEQITQENAAGIIAKKYESSMQKETWKNAVKISQGMLGLFDEQSGEIFILPQTIHNIAGGMSEKDIAKIVLSHELIHKIQHDVNNTVSTDFDGQLAWAAVTEGQALIIGEKAAAEMNTPKDVLQKINDFTKDVMPNKLSPTQQIASQMTAEIYSAGKSFMTWQMINGGNKKMWQIIENPPSTTDTIYHPQSYPVKGKKRDYTYLFSDINIPFPGKMRMLNTSIGVMAQRVIYSDMNTSDKAALLEHIKTVQTAAFDNDEKTASVSVIILDNANLTGRFVVAAERIAIKNNPNAAINSFVSGEIAGRKIKMGNSILYRTFYNTTVIEITSNGINLNDISAAKIIRNVIGKLKAK
jgi:hypothetical protein